MEQVLKHEVGPQRRLRTVSGAEHVVGCWSIKRTIERPSPEPKPYPTTGCTTYVAATVRRRVRMKIVPAGGSVPPIAEGGGGGRRSRGQRSERGRINDLSGPGKPRKARWRRSPKTDVTRGSGVVCGVCAPHHGHGKHQSEGGVGARKKIRVARTVITGSDKIRDKSDESPRSFCTKVEISLRWPVRAKIAKTREREGRQPSLSPAHPSRYREPAKKGCVGRRTGRGI